MDKVHYLKSMGQNGYGQEVFINLCEYGPLPLKPGYIKTKDKDVTCEKCIGILVNWKGR